MTRHTPLVQAVSRHPILVAVGVCGVTQVVFPGAISRKPILHPLLPFISPNFLTLITPRLTPRETPLCPSRQPLPKETTPSSYCTCGFRA